MMGTLTPQLQTVKYLMYLLINKFFQICLFRAEPQDLPASTFLMVASLIMYGLIGLLVELNRTPFSLAIAMVAIDLIVLGGLSWIILWVRQLNQRFPQTLTALAGCGALLTLFAWPMLLVQGNATDNIGNSFIIILMWLWFFWQILVYSHIISRALSTSLFVSTGLILVYVYISYSVAQTLFFQPAAGT